MAPVVMERQVNLPPVVTIAGVLLIGKLFGLGGPHHRGADPGAGDDSRPPHPARRGVRRSDQRRRADAAPSPPTPSRPSNPLTPDRMTAPRFLIVADGDFAPMTSKTANSVIRYLPDRTVGVLDRQQAGKTVQDVLGFGGSIPVVGSMREGLARGPDRGADRHRAAGRADAGRVARAGWRRRSTTAATSGAGSTPSSATIPLLAEKARGGRPEDLRPAAAAGGSPDRVRARQDGRARWSC